MEKVLEELVRRGVVSAKEAEAIRANIMKRSRLI
jgi:polyhydroxyalkanoate synthesis regulator phasin